MKKISIKREQSQAGLSFAERENRRSAAGGKAKFRPQVKNKLLLLLVLLMTAATGAWATTPNSIVINGTPQVGDKSISLTYHFDPNNVPNLQGYVPTLKVKCAADNKWDETNLSLHEVSSSTTIISLNTLGEFEAGKTYEVCFAYNNGNWVDEVFQSFVPAAAGYTVSLKDGVKDADKWTVKVDDGQAQALPIGGLKGDGTEKVTLQYNGRLKVKGVKATSEAAPAAGKTVDLSTLTADYEAQNGDVLTGVTSSYSVTIAAGATVTLDGVTINRGSYCIKCLGDATIILKDGSTNTLTGTGDAYPALSIGDANTTLTIQGSTGVLNVTSGPYCAGIGGGYNNANKTCGNIRIEGGVITAQGGNGGSGIGSDAGTATCGDIIITGGTITAKGGTNAAGIGTGGSGMITPAVCGDITIANTVTKVTATKGANAAHSIGKGSGDNATCGTVTIGGTKYWENNAAVNGGDTYLAKSPLTYDPAAPAKTPATVTTAPQAKTDVEAGSTTALIEAGVADGGTLMYAVTTTNTKPTSTDGFSATVPTAETITASGTVYVWYYVKGDDTHSDSEIAGPVSVTVTPALSLTNPVVGQVIGSDGKNYAAGATLPSGVTKVAMIAYVSGSNGLAIALADEGSFNWATAKTTCEAKTPAFTNGTWHLPSQAEWNQMFSANGGDEESYGGLNTAINTAGGTALLEKGTGYWSSTPDGSKANYVYLIIDVADWRSGDVNLDKQVRACLAF